MRALIVCALLLINFSPFLTAQDNLYTTIDQYIGNRYEFSMFENFERCAELYKAESGVIQTIADIKDKLLTFKINLTNGVNEYESNIDHLKHKRTQMRKFKTDHFSKKDVIYRLSKHFPKRNDYDGAVKAMFMLHYTYYLNITKAVTDGILSYNNVEDQNIIFAVNI